MIAVLDKDTIDKIAAGEVVERPASIVKELLENAIDAGATSITVEIKDGGKSLIRVTDNGSGIAKDEVRIAFLRHATSKIQSADDLQNITSLGFRGEALSSIAAVSKMEMITKVRSEMVGHWYVIEGGIEQSFEEVGAVDGTSIIVRDLFFNTPARRKFLKSNQTEAAHIAELVEKIALSHQDVSIRLIANNQAKLQTSGNGNLKDSIYRLYGREVAMALLPVEYRAQGIEITGVIAKPEVSRASRSMEMYFVNGRYIKAKTIASAIEEGYGNRLMQHQYPFTVLNYHIPPEVMDVNVHPTKMEVRFSEEVKIYEVTRDAIVSALMEKELIKRVEADRVQLKRVSDLPVSDVKQKGKISEAFETKPQHNQRKIQEKIENYQVPNDPVSNPIFLDRPQEEKTNQVVDKVWNSTEEVPVVGEQLKFLDKKNLHLHKIVGQIFGTYWIVEFNQKMIVIDQHAAHEKVLYERLMKQYQNTVPSQMVVPPILLTLTAIEADALNQNQKVLSDLGFHIENFGGNEYRIDGVPSILPSVSKKEMLKELIAELADHNQLKTPESIIAKTASMACKAAVKGNHTLSLLEAKALIDELMSLENPYNCPHGRPTMFEMSKYEIEKKFKRIV
jgi:DNA mismatch repair protein mutL